MSASFFHFVRAWLPKSKTIRTRCVLASCKRRLLLEQLEDRLVPSAQLWTDKLDYAPWETALLTADNFAPGETVEFQVLHTDGRDNSGTEHLSWRLADNSVGDLDPALGTIQTTWAMCPDALNSSFQATALGLTSGLSAGTAFTDAIPNPVTIATAGNTTSSTTLQSALFSQAVPVGNTVIVTVAMDPNLSVVSVADGKGNTYSLDASVINGSGTSGVRTLIFSAPVTTALTTTDRVTVTFGTATAAKAVSVHSVSGLVSSSVRDQSQTATGNSASPSSGATAATAQPDELLIGAVGVEAKGNAMTAGSSFTLLTQANTGNAGPGASNIIINSEYRIVNAAGAYAATGTMTAANWAAAIVTYKVSVPTVVSINRVNPNPTSAASVDFAVTFGKSVTGVDAADFALAASGVAGASITAVSGSGTAYTVTANTGSGSGSIGLNLVDNDTILDSNLNPLGGTGTAGVANGSFTGQVYTVIKNTAPALAAIEGTTLSYTENDAATAITSTLTVTDVDSATLVEATVQITGNYQSGEDTLSFADQNGIIGSWNSALGLMTLSGAASLANYQTALRSVGYSNSSENPNTTIRTATFQVNDGGSSNNLSNSVTRSMAITAVNDAPALAGIESAPLTYRANDPATQITSTLTASDIDNVTFAGATVSITSGFTSAEDVLSFNTAGTAITGSYAAGTGVLSFSGVDTLSNYQSVLRSVEYNNTNGSPSTADRVISFQVDDGQASSNLSNLATRTINIVVNAVPIVSANLASVAVNEGQGAVNTGSYSDSDTGDTVTISASIGAVTKTGTNSGTWSWTFSSTDGPAQSQTVFITANDGNGGIASTSFALIVDNVAPTATLSNDGPITYGQSVTISLSSQQDDSSDDTAAGFHYAYATSPGGFAGVTYSTNSTLLSSQGFSGLSAGTHTLYARIIDKDDGFSQYSTSVTVNPKALVGSITALDKEYDATTAATISSRSLSGIVGGDDVSYIGGTASFADKNVGVGKTVTGTGLSLSGADAGNYSVNTTAITTATITARALTVTATGVNKTYDGTTLATVSLSDDRIAGDIFSAGYTSATFADKNVGANKPVSVSGISLTGPDAGNYTANSSASTSADITARALIVSATGINRTYDGTTLATVNLSDDRIAGDVFGASYTSASFADKNVGINKTVSVSGISISGPDAGNYTANSSALATADITALGLTGSITALDKEYDATTAATISSRSLSGIIGGDDVNYIGGTADFADKNVGAGKTVTGTGLSLSGTDAGNYSVNSSAITTATITARALTVTATGIDRAYDGTTLATVNLSDDRIAGDIFGASYTSASFADKNVGINKAVSVSGISISGPDAGNYTANSSALATADITALGLTGSITALDKEYDATTAATISSRSLSGVIGGDDVSYIGGTASFSDKNVGAGKTVTGTGLSLSGADAGNYSVNTTAITTATITARALAVTATGVNKTYDGTTLATVNLSDDRIAGDIFSAGYTSATFADKNVGTLKPVNVSGISLTGPDSGNYTANSSASTSADITARTLTVSATGINRTYDGTTLATVNLSDDRIAGDIFSASYTSASFADKNVGINKPVSVSGISISGPDAGNYTANSSAVATADITALGLTGSITALDKEYDATTAATISSRSLSGVLGGDDVSYIGGTASFSDKNVGVGKTVTGTGLSLSGADAGNYSVNSSAITTATITARALTVTATGVNKTYDGTTLATVNLSDDRIAGDVFSTGYTSASFADAAVGLNKPVSVIGISLSGPDSGNYTANTSASTTADILENTTTTLISSPNPSAVGQLVTFTATITAADAGAGVPVGTVTFTEGATVLASGVVVDNSGQAAFSTSSLTIGSHTITAAFTGVDGWLDSSGNNAGSPHLVIGNPTTRTWIGGGADNNWSTADNWVGAVAPAPGDDLVFGPGASTQASNNDFAAGDTFNSISFTADGYSITGNAISLVAGLTNSAGANAVNLPITLLNDQTFAASSSTSLTLNGTVNTAGFLLTANSAGSVNMSFNNTISGAGALTKIGSGIVTLGASGGNTFAGGVTLTSGILAIGGTGVAGSGALTLQAGTLLTNGSFTLSNAVALDGNITFDGVGNLTLSGPVTMPGDRTLTVVSLSSATLAGVITESGGTWSVTKAGAGTLVLSGNNAYGGGTVLSAGILAVGDNNALGSGTLTLAAGTIRADGAPRTVSNAVTLGGNVTLGGSQALTFSSAATMTGNRTLTVSNTALTTFAAGIGQSLGGRSLTKGGAGTLVLTGASSYTGETMVTGGTLRVDGTLSSAVSVGSTATLAGSGTVTGISVQNGGKVSPGSSPGILRSGSVVFGTGSTFFVDINGLTAGTGHDQLKVTGTVTLNGGTVTGARTIAVPNNTILIIIDNDGTDAVVGTFSGLPENSLVSIGGQLFRISYRGGTGNDVTLKASNGFNE